MQKNVIHVLTCSYGIYIIENQTDNLWLLSKTILDVSLVLKIYFYWCSTCITPVYYKTGKKKTKNYLKLYTIFGYAL